MSFRRTMALMSSKFWAVHTDTVPSRGSNIRDQAVTSLWILLLGFRHEISLRMARQPPLSGWPLMAFVILLNL